MASNLLQIVIKASKKKGKNLWTVIRIDCGDAEAVSVSPRAFFSLEIYLRNNKTRSSNGITWGIFWSSSWRETKLQNKKEMNYLCEREKHIRRFVLPEQIASHALVRLREVSSSRPWRASGPWERMDACSRVGRQPLAMYELREIGCNSMPTTHRNEKKKRLLHAGRRYTRNNTYKQSEVIKIYIRSRNNAYRPTHSRWLWTWNDWEMRKHCKTLTAWRAFALRTSLGHPERCKTKNEFREEIISLRVW